MHSMSVSAQNPVNGQAEAGESERLAGVPLVYALGRDDGLNFRALAASTASTALP
jgi:hypothetical protein